MHYDRSIARWRHGRPSGTRGIRTLGAMRSILSRLIAKVFPAVRKPFHAAGFVGASVSNCAAGPGNEANRAHRIRDKRAIETAVRVGASAALERRLRVWQSRPIFFSRKNVASRVRLRLPAPVNLKLTKSRKTILTVSEHDSGAASSHWECQECRIWRG
jgi:hypothetical protein